MESPAHEVSAQISSEQRMRQFCLGSAKRNTKKNGRSKSSKKTSSTNNPNLCKFVQKENLKNAENEENASVLLPLPVSQIDQMANSTTTEPFFIGEHNRNPTNIEILPVLDAFPLSPSETIQCHHIHINDTTEDKKEDTSFELELENGFSPLKRLKRLPQLTTPKEHLEFSPIETITLYTPPNISITPPTLERRSKQKAILSIQRDTQKKIRAHETATNRLRELYLANIDREAVDGGSIRQESEEEENFEESEDQTNFPFIDDSSPLVINSSFSNGNVQVIVLDDSEDEETQPQTQHQPQPQPQPQSQPISLSPLSSIHTNTSKFPVPDPMTYSMLTEPEIIELTDSPIENPPPAPVTPQIIPLVQEVDDISKKDTIGIDELENQLQQLDIKDHPGVCHDRSSKWNLSCPVTNTHIKKTWNSIQASHRATYRAYKLQTIEENFARDRVSLASRYFTLFNESAFENKLPDISIEWIIHKGAAGFCRCLKQNKTRIVPCIALNPNNNKSDLEMKQTLLHEMCHAATWIFDGHSGHGKPWLRYVKIVERKLPKLAPIGRSLFSRWEYPYFCSNMNCAKEYFAHTRSSRKVCRVCKHPVVLPPNWSEPARYSRPLNKFAVFVKENYSEFKAIHPDASHKELMGLLSVQYKLTK